MANKYKIQQNAIPYHAYQQRNQKYLKNYNKLTLIREIRRNSSLP